MKLQRVKLLRPTLFVGSAAFCFIALAAATFNPSKQPFGYIAAPAVSGSDVADGLVAYVPKFEFGSYVGDVVAANILPSGEIDLLAPLWKASDQVALQDWDLGRFIFTRHLDGYATPFRKDDLDGDQKDLLKGDEEKRINFIRGDRTEEGNKFRVRTHVLGDIIHSTPVYVGPAPAALPFDGHTAFAASVESRPGRIYVGANDGMLHAFDAATGKETFAYVPSMLLAKLQPFAAEGYVHDYFVDGPLSVGDAKVSNAWTTVLVGTLGAGGKGVFALDVTSAAPIADEIAAGDKLMWEFSPTSLGGANLGYTYARGTVAKLNDGRWGVIVGNGYLSASGVASLFILDVTDGSVIRELTVSDIDANGLSSPAVIDVNGDRVADFAYAGDLNGNVWRFDLTAEASGDWTVGFANKPLFVALDDTGARQPITSKVDVSLHPQGGVLVHAATGRLLDDSEGADLQEQAVYGVWDKDWAAAEVPVTQAELLQQSLRSLVGPGGVRVRTATDNAPDWATHKGWRTSLRSAGDHLGERVIQDISLSNGRVNISTVNPSITTGANWLLQIDRVTGGAPSSVVFDLNGDGQFDVGDNVDGDGDGNVTADAVDRVAGLYKGFGLVSRQIEARIDAASDAVIFNMLSGTNPIHSEPAPPAGEPGTDDYGLVGGHMDLDVSSQTYPISGGTTDKHDHEWDNEWGTIVDTFEIDNMGGFRAVDQNIDQPGSTPNSRFIINIANAGLSPGAILEVNGVDFPVVEWQAKVKRFLSNTQKPGEWFPVFKLGATTPADQSKGILQLTSLKIKFSSDAITVGGLHPTATGCVKGNEPSPDGEYRNGALTTQLLDAAGLSYANGAADPASVSHQPLNQRYDAGSFAIHDRLNYAVPPGNTTHGPSDGLFWESTLFWHWGGGCYVPDKIDDYRVNFLDATGVEDNRTHDGVPTGNFDDPYAPEPEPDPDAPEPEPTRDENTEHTTSTDRVSSGGASGRLFWREWIPDNL